MEWKSSFVEIVAKPGRRGKNDDAPFLHDRVSEVLIDKVYENPWKPFPSYIEAGREFLKTIRKAGSFSHESNTKAVPIQARVGPRAPGLLMYIVR